VCNTLPRPQPSAALTDPSPTKPSCLCSSSPQHICVTQENVWLSAHVVGVCAVGGCGSWAHTCTHRHPSHTHTRRCDAAARLGHSVPSVQVAAAPLHRPVAGGETAPPLLADLSSAHHSCMQRTGIQTLLALHPCQYRDRIPRFHARRSTARYSLCLRATWTAVDLGQTAVSAGFLRHLSRALLAAPAHSPHSSDTPGCVGFITISSCAVGGGGGRPPAPHPSGTHNRGQVLT
jgi:hypothetical protein